MKKILFLLFLLPSLSFADRLGSLKSGSDVLLTTQAVSGSSVYSATSTPNLPFGFSSTTATFTGDVQMSANVALGQVLYMAGLNLTVVGDASFKWFPGGGPLGTGLLDVREITTDGFLVGANTTASANISFLETGQATFNEQGLDQDFRIESDNQANMFFLDASVDTINMGGTTGKVIQPFIRVQSSATVEGPFTVNDGTALNKYSMSFDPSQDTLNINQEFVSTDAGRLTFSTLGSVKSYFQADAGSWGIGVSTGAAPYSRISLTSDAASKGKIIFNSSNNGFSLGQSSMTFDSDGNAQDAGDPTFSWQTDGDLNLNSSTFSITGMLTASRSTSIGWSRQSAANQDCNTTCANYACAFGLDQGTLGVVLPSLVDCSDATADQCTCMGPN